jgi:hypothetical protein
MPWVGFEPTIPASKRAKTVHVLDRAATVTGNDTFYASKLRTANVKGDLKDSGRGGAGWIHVGSG